ncbi:hypothetical protein LSAT2_028417 [Lamellibrachia satsuma]|nr:hypothetical protein LSAT2_028417 [Lamellibrachia satsuma]
MAALTGQDPHLQQLITEALSNTCRKYFSGFKTNLTVAGTVGITVDNSHVCIVQVLDELLPDTAYSAKHLGEHTSEKRSAACASQHVCMGKQSNSCNVITNNTIVIEPSVEKHKQTAQSRNQTGTVHVGLPVTTKNNRLLTPENSSLLSLLTTGNKPKDVAVSENALTISAVWGSASKVYTANREPLPASSGDAALDLCTGSERVMQVVPDCLRCVSPNIANSERVCVSSATDGDSTSDTRTAHTSHIDGNTAQLLQQLMRKNVTKGMTNTSPRSSCQEDTGFASAAKRIKLETVEMSTKQCSSPPPNNSAHKTPSMPSVRYNLTESVQASAPNVVGKVTQLKPVVRNERKEANNTNSSAIVDSGSLASAPTAVKSEGTKAKVRTSSMGKSCRSEKSEIDLTTGTAMTMNDLVDFYIRKEIFHNRK